MKLLKEMALKCGIQLNEEMLIKFKKYMEMMLDYNEKVNLTAITEPNEVMEKHFLDSMTLEITNKLYPGCSLIDVGAGAGFPSIPIKILRDDINVTMLDSLKKRVIFLENVINELKLQNIKAIHLRAEDGGHIQPMRENFDIAAARAVADLSVLSEYTLPFVKKGGFFIAMKGSSPEEELNNAKKAIKILGGKTQEVKKITLPSGIEHSLIIIEKVKETPSKYPRKPGKALKEPI